MSELYMSELIRIINDDIYVNRICQGKLEIGKNKDMTTEVLSRNERGNFPERFEKKDFFTTLVLCYDHL